jgi:hypothetical protein
VGVLEQIDAACRSDLPGQKLEQLVYSLSAQGFTRQEIYEIFYNIRHTWMYSRIWLAMEEQHNNHHPMDIILDRLAGFCNPKYILLRHESFTDKERESYHLRNVNSQDRPRMKRRTLLLVA